MNLEIRWDLPDGSWRDRYHTMATLVVSKSLLLFSRPLSASFSCWTMILFLFHCPLGQLMICSSCSFWFPLFFPRYYLLVLVLILRSLLNLIMRFTLSTTLLFGVLPYLVKSIAYDTLAPADIAKLSAFDGCMHKSTILMAPSSVARRKAICLQFPLQRSWGDGFLHCCLLNCMACLLVLFTFFEVCFFKFPGNAVMRGWSCCFQACSPHSSIYPCFAFRCASVAIIIDDSAIPFPCTLGIIAGLQNLFKSSIWVLHPCILGITFLMIVLFKDLTLPSYRIEFKSLKTRNLSNCSLFWFYSYDNKSTNL